MLFGGVAGECDAGRKELQGAVLAGQLNAGPFRVMFGAAFTWFEVVL